MKRVSVLLFMGALTALASASLVTDGLIIHLDADTISADDGSRVASWADSAIGDGVDVTLTNENIDSSNGYKWRPRMVTNAINGHKAVDFTLDGDGVDHALGSEEWSWDASKGVTMIMVAQGGDFAVDGNTNQRAVQVGPQGAGGAGNDNNGHVFSADLSSANDGASSSGIRFNNGYALSGAGQQNPVTQDTWHISFRQLAQNADLDQAFYAVNNLTNLVANVPDNDNAMTLVDADNKLILGAAFRSAGAINEYYQGQIAEVLIYNGQLTEAQMAEVGNYLADKYALTFVPEPATLVLLGLGAVGSLMTRRRKA